MAEAKNWFIGLPVSPDGWFERIPAPPASIRLFAPTDLHLTVAFLGQVTEDAARAAWQAISWSSPATDITLGSVVPMGTPCHWSALSVLLGDGREAIEDGIGRHRGAAYAAAGAEPDDRTPKAHVTIGRLKRKASDSERVAARTWADGIAITPLRLRVDRIALYTWSEDRSRTLFRRVEEGGLPRT